MAFETKYTFPMAMHYASNQRSIKTLTKLPLGLVIGWNVDVCVNRICDILRNDLNYHCMLPCRLFILRTELCGKFSAIAEIPL